MDKVFKPNEVEKRIYEMWEKAGYFRPEINPLGKPYTIILPPPNANADLHLGNALYVIEDILIRYHRMRGDAALWVPGIDHAGILSQVVFERKLKKEQNKTRFDLGREEFFKQVYGFCLNNKSVIEGQLRAMGFSLDWEREKFTLDPEISKIVYTTFVKLYNDGLIYRGNRMVNWCTHCYTTLSDLETEEREQEDQLYYLDYGSVKIATTRPETIFADAVIAVNPKDKRYKGLIGRSATIPLINKEIPIIADGAVELAFGTGALKVTPAHDPTDFEIGERHGLEKISVIDFNGKISLDFDGLKGLPVKEAREKTLALLIEEGKLLKTEPLRHSVKTCERCKNIIEPLISRQWFVKMTPLAKMGIEAVKNGKIRFTPSRWTRQYFHWMEGLRDWPVSRQIWWGHQMPVFYCVDCQGKSGQAAAKLILENSPLADPTSLENPIVSVEKTRTCPQCNGSNIIQDPDTFDTWFSSGQWPLTTLLTNRPGDFERFYPTAVLDTGWEIFWLWVTRMIMFGLYVTGQVPFVDVLAHGMLRDAKGQKMSKSRGNGVDPLEMINKYGADATRLGLVAGRDITSDWMIDKHSLEERIRGFRNYTNKIWNIGRFIFLNTQGKTVPQYRRNLSGLLREDKEIIGSLTKLVKNVESDINKYRPGSAADRLYQFIWHEFADKYIESSKERIRNNDLAVLAVLLYVYSTFLKLLHPFMPYVTEEIWQKLPTNYGKHLMISSWPTPQH